MEEEGKLTTITPGAERAAEAEVNKVSRQAYSRCPVRMIGLCPWYGKSYRICRFKPGPIKTETCREETDGRIQECETYREVRQAIKEIVRDAPDGQKETELV